MSSGRAALSALAAFSGGGPPAARTLATWPVACTPVSVRPATSSRLQAGKDDVERIADDPLDRPLFRLPRPAAEAAAVVLERQLQGLFGHGRAV